MKLIDIADLVPEENLPVFVLIKSLQMGIYKARAMLIEQDGQKAWKALGEYEFESNKQFLPFEDVASWALIPGFDSKHFPPL